MAMTIGSPLIQQNDDEQMFSNMFAHKLKIVNEEDKADKHAELLARFWKRISQYQVLERTRFPNNFLS